MFYVCTISRTNLRPMLAPGEGKHGDEKQEAQEVWN